MVYSLQRGRDIKYKMLPADNGSQNHRTTIIFCYLKIWNFQRVCEDNESLRTIGLLRTLIRVRLNGVTSIQSYVDGVTNTTNKWSGTGLDIVEDWIGAIFSISSVDWKKLMVCMTDVGYICCTCGSKHIEHNHTWSRNNSNINGWKIGSYRANWIFTFVVNTLVKRKYSDTVVDISIGRAKHFLKNLDKAYSKHFHPRDKFVSVRGTEVIIHGSNGQNSIWDRTRRMICICNIEELCSIEKLHIGFRYFVKMVRVKFEYFFKFVFDCLIFSINFEEVFFSLTGQ